MKVNEVNATTLATFELFRGLGIEERKAISQLMSLRRYGVEENLISVSSNNTDVFFLISGKVRAYAVSDAGKLVQFEDLNAGMMFGELAAIDGLPRGNDCVAVEESSVATISAENFFAVMQKHPLVMRAVMERLAALVRKHVQRVYEFSTENVGSRVQLELVRMIRTGEGVYDNPAMRFNHVPTHADIASRISSHREAVTRELKKMEKIGLITWSPGNYVIHDVDAFEVYVLG